MPTTYAPPIGGSTSTTYIDPSISDWFTNNLTVEVLKVEEDVKELNLEDRFLSQFE